VIVIEFVEHALAVLINDGVRVAVPHHVEEADAADTKCCGSEAENCELQREWQEAVAPGRGDELSFRLIVGVRREDLRVARRRCFIPLALRRAVAQSRIGAEGGVAVEDDRDVVVGELVEASVAEVGIFAAAGTVVGRSV